MSYYNQKKFNEFMASMYKKKMQERVVYPEDKLVVERNAILDKFRGYNNMRRLSAGSGEQLHIRRLSSSSEEVGKSMRRSSVDVGEQIIERSVSVDDPPQRRIASLEKLKKLASREHSSENIAFGPPKKLKESEKPQEDVVERKVVTVEVDPPKVVINDIILKCIEEEKRGEDALMCEELKNALTLEELEESEKNVKESSTEESSTESSEEESSEESSESSEDDKEERIERFIESYSLNSVKNKEESVVNATLLYTFLSKNPDISLEDIQEYL